MESAALDTDQWLKDNAFHCIRLEANISKPACDIYRAENQNQIKNRGNVESATKIIIPGCCQDCPQADGELLESKYKTRFTDNLYQKRKQKQKPIKKVEKLAPDIVPAPKIKEDKMADKKTGDCIGPCGRKGIVIIGRGLCSKCYYHARKAEKTVSVEQEKTPKETVTIFIKESCVIGDCEITLLDLYAAYKKWWCENPKNEKKKPLTNVEFYKTLVDYKREKKGGQTYIQGISLVEKEPSQETEDVGVGHPDLSIETEKEDVADQPAINPDSLDEVPCPEWVKFINAIHQEDPETSEYIQRLLGYLTIDPGVKNHLAEDEKLSFSVCRECGCTELDCSVCIEKTSQPCYLVEPDLCSACVPSWIPCSYDPDKNEYEIYGMGSFTLAQGEQVLTLEETEDALLKDLTIAELDNVASVTKILRVGGHEIERTTVYKNESSGPSGLQRYLPAIVAPIVISALILIHPEYWKHFIFVSIQVGALFTFLESRKKKG